MEEENIDLLKSAITETKRVTKTSELTRVLQEISENGSKEIQKEEYFEIETFIKVLGEPYISEIPMSFRVFFENRKLPISKFKLDKNKEIKDQNLKTETLAIIAFLNLKYWCTENREKAKLARIYEQNEEKSRTTIEEVSDLLDEIEEEQEERKQIKNEPINKKDDKQEEKNIEEIENNKQNEESNSKTQLALVAMSEKKRSIFKIILDKIKSIFHIKSRKQIDENI